MKAKLVVAVLGVCVVGALAVGSAAAKARPSKNGKPHQAAKASHAKTKPRPKPGAAGPCKLGETPKYDHCTTNAAFGNPVCPTLTPLLQAVAPGVAFAPGFRAPGVGSSVYCFWKVNGYGQAAVVRIAGWKGGLVAHLKHEGSAHPDRSIKNLTTAGQFQSDYAAEMRLYDEQASNKSTCPYPNAAAAQAGPGNEAPEAAPAKTTVDGHPAWVWYPCPPMDSSSPDYATWPKGTSVWVEVLDGTVLYSVDFNGMSNTGWTADEAEAVVPGLIAKYQTFAP